MTVPWTESWTAGGIITTSGTSLTAAVSGTAVYRVDWNAATIGAWLATTSVDSVMTWLLNGVPIATIGAVSEQKVSGLNNAAHGQVANHSGSFDITLGAGDVLSLTCVLTGSDNPSLDSVQAAVKISLRN
jgi:hypothetical protein